ncbi:putative membrane protein [Paenisporosarcina sp. OV554]|nr:putative membrane protein [Paenisporosarcina sp. OV554]
MKTYLLDKYLKKYTRMSERELAHQVKSNLWFTPVLYVLFSMILLSVTLNGDLNYGMGNKMISYFAVDYELTLSLLSVLTAATLTITIFTFNLVLVVFTTFSGQFSPRILKNFISSKATQRVLGIFTGSFIYVLLSLFFLNKRITEYYFAVPITATFLAIFSMATFIFFINHAVAWLQVNQLTDDMKKEALGIVKGTLKDELDSYKVKDFNDTDADIRNGKGLQIKAGTPGYIQLVDFISMIEEAKKDDIMMRFEHTIGSYVFESTPLLTYWKKHEMKIDEDKYLAFFSVRKKQTEVQDIEFSINKLVEVAIRALGNYDPKTATTAIYQVSEVLVSISLVTDFSNYLADDENNLRLLLQKRDFNHYLYNGLGYIRHYAKDNVIVSTDILKALDLMAKSLNPRDYQSVWDFAIHTALGFENLFLFEQDSQQFYLALYNLATTTNNQKDYEKFLKKM